MSAGHGCYKDAARPLSAAIDEDRHPRFPRLGSVDHAGSFSMRPRFAPLFLAAVFGFGAHVGIERPAAAVSLDDHATPGGMIIGTAPPGSQVSVDGRLVRISDDGRFVFGVGRNGEGQVSVVVDPPKGEKITRTVVIDKRGYDIQRIDGLPARKVEPNKDDQARIETDWVMLNEAKATDSAILAFAEGAVWPVTGRISGVFGSQRILNGKPKSPHRGVDVAAPVGTPVGAMMDGVVTVAATDMYYTGGTVMVDHGHGIQSLYAHLSAVDVKVGQQLDKGQQLGLIGATGRATGPHLHFSLYWFKTALDPALILDPMPEPQKAAGTQ
ncbi:MAG: peptidoglycan DD-metalloendopeptidase family protein [Geminicoccaceae bacterium]